MSVGSLEVRLFFPLLSFIAYNAKTRSEITFSYVSGPVHKLNLASFIFRTGEHWMACSQTELQHSVPFRCFSRRPQHCPYTSSHVCAVDIHKSDKVFMSSKFRCLTITRIRSWHSKVTKASQEQSSELRNDGSPHRYPGMTRIPLHPIQDHCLYTNGWQISF